MTTSVNDKSTRRAPQQNRQGPKKAELANIVTIETGDGSAMVTKIGVFTGVFSHPLS